jgi:hypothetical protein
MHKVTITGYMKLIVEAIPVAILAYPIRRVIEVRALRALSKTVFHASLKELKRSVFLLNNA